MQGNKDSMCNPSEKQTEVSSMLETQMQLSDILVTENETGYANYLFLYQLCYVLLSTDLQLLQLKVINIKPLSYTLDITEQNTVGQLSSLPSLYLLEQLCLSRAVFPQYH